MDKNEYSLKIDIASGEVSSWKGDALIIGVYDGAKAQTALTQCGEVVEKEVNKYLKAGWLKGNMGENISLPMPDNSGLNFSRLVLLGLGKNEKLKAESFRVVGSHINTLCNKSEIKTACTLITLDTHGKDKEKDKGKEKGKEKDKEKSKKKAALRPEQVLDALAEGAWLTSYHFEMFKSKELKEKDEKKEKHVFQKLTLGYREKTTAKEEKDNLDTSDPLANVTAICRGVAFARNLGNQPGNLLNPEALAEQARQLGKRLPTIKTTIFTEKSLLKKGMNAILAVGSGSASPPRMITMEYRQGDDKPLLAVVGKGITFDSGGISLKPGGSMEDMKYDMSGAGAVFGLMQAIAEMKLPINVVGVVPAAENLPSATAQRPGDIIKTAKGVFVEVVNTDAEGRLILADALYHASSFKPKSIIDIATLTGACVVALGAQASGLMGNNEDLLSKLQKAGDASGERLWPLPFYDEYKEQVKSTVADIKNVGGKGAGTITAACFLAHFIEENQPWAHIDIAGTAWESGGRPYIPKGSVGVGVRMLCQFIQENWM